MALAVRGYAHSNEGSAAATDQAKVPALRKPRPGPSVRAGSAESKGGPMATAQSKTNQVSATNARQKWLHDVTHFGRYVTKETGGLPYGNGEPVTLNTLPRIVGDRYPAHPHRAIKRENSAIALSERAMALVKAPLRDGRAPSPSDQMIRLADLADSVITATNGLPKKVQLTNRILLNFIIIRCTEEITGGNVAKSQDLGGYLRSEVASLNEEQRKFWLGPTLRWLDDQAVPHNDSSSAGLVATAQ